MQKILINIKKITWTPHSLLFTFSAIILTRLMGEGWLSRFVPHSGEFYFFETLHTFLFFAILFIVCVAILHMIAGISVNSSVTILIFGFLLIIFPPIIDWIISIKFYNGSSFMSYYLFDDAQGLLLRYITFFGDQPHNGITYGTRIMIACALALISIATYVSTKNVRRTAMAFIVTYTIFFIMSSTPSLLTYTLDNARYNASAAIVASKIASPTTIFNNQIGDALNAINIKMTLLYTVILTILLLIISYRFRRALSISLWRNMRPIQSLYHIGLLIVGIFTAIIFGNIHVSLDFFSLIAFTILCCGIIMAWYSTVVFNDIIDIDIDRISNVQRPLVKKMIDPEAYRSIGHLFCLLSLIFVAMLNMYAAAVLLGYHAISYLYNTPPLRLKRFPIVATFLAAIASFFIVVIGYVIVVPSHSLIGFPPQIAILLIISYTISLPIKDLKDIHGDAQNKIYTIPVLFGEKFARLAIGTGIFASFLLSIIALNTWALFWPAICSGSLCFWTIVGRDKNGFVFGTHAVLYVTFAIVAIYGIILGTSLLQ